MRRPALLLATCGLACTAAMAQRPPLQEMPGPYTVQPYPVQRYQGQPYPGQPYQQQPNAGQPYQGQAYQGQAYQGQAYQGQPYQQQQYPGQPYQGQPYPQQQYPGQPYPVQRIPPHWPPSDTMQAPPPPSSPGITSGQSLGITSGRDLLRSPDAPAQDAPGQNADGQDVTGQDQVQIPVQAPEVQGQPPPGSADGPRDQPAAPPEPAQPQWPNQWVPAVKARIQALDKVNAQAATLTVQVGQPVTFGSLRIAVRACVVRPPDQPADAAAYLDVTDSHPDEPGFNGWMLANEPAVSMMQNPIYDLRVAGCT